jgi:hypothetical protein
MAESAAAAAAAEASEGAAAAGAGEAMEMPGAGGVPEEIYNWAADQVRANERVENEMGMGWFGRACMCARGGWGARGDEWWWWVD